MPVMNDYDATAVCGCFGFYSRADNSASYPNCNGTYDILHINDGTNVKKWDESGNVTHVCKIREELRRFCIKLKLGKRHMKYDDEK